MRPTTAGQDVRMGRMDNNGSYVVSVSLKRVALLESVVVEDSDCHVVRPRHHPTLPHHKLGRSN